MAVIPVPVLLDFYRSGMFPMADNLDGEIYLYSPDPRGIIEFDSFLVSRSLRRTIRSGDFEIRINTAFPDVIRNCAERDDTWISRDLIQSYIKCHKAGYAHSVETWFDGELVGGLYGIALGGAFFGESMYHKMKDASKVALVSLVERMKKRGMVLLDTQYTTPHLISFGAKEIPRDEYLKRLKEALGIQSVFYP